MLTGWTRRGRSKYNARRSRGLFSGRWYDSGAERDRGEELAAMVAAGEVDEVVHQPRLELLPGVFYRPDFAVRGAAGVWWEDVKGVETERFRVIRQVWALVGPGPLVVLRRPGRAWTATRVEPAGLRLVDAVLVDTAAGLRAAALELAEAPRRTPRLVAAVRDAVAMFDAARP